MKQPLTGSILLLSGLFFVSKGVRPWLDFDFIFVWYGVLLLMDSMVKSLTGISIFSPLRSYVLVAFTSTFFWLFYEWANLIVGNWSYPFEPLYSNMEWTLLSAVAFTTVLPWLIVCSRLASLFWGETVQFSRQGLTLKTSAVWIVVGLVALGLTLSQPTYAFPLLWIVVLLVIDPINATQKKPSLLVETIRANFTPLLLLTVAALVAGLGWEIINWLVPKWLYALPTWFWQLPDIFTYKIVEMPITGFFGYVPFIWSAFAVVTLLDLPVRWFVKKNSS